MQSQISSAKTYCELAAKQPISETSQSCVSSTASLSHRFKSSPAIPGKVAIPGTAGYMMNAGHFSENLESSGDLNRSLGVQRAATLDLLETWSPCSRPFAILPVSAVSDAQKLATGNFLHVRAALSLLLSQQFLPLRGFKFRVIIQNAPKNMTAL